MSNLRRRDAASPFKMSDSTKKWCVEMMNDVTAIDAFNAQISSDDEGDMTDVIEDDMIIKVMEDNMTYMQEARSAWSSFSLKSEDFETLEDEVENINNNYPDNVADWDEQMVDDALLDDDDIIMPQVAMSDQGSDGLFSDDDDLMDPNVMANLYQVKEEIKEEVVEVEDKSKQVMRWCFTMNNPKLSGSELDVLLSKTPNVKGYVFQLEEGANGTPHFQGYIEFEKKVTAGGIRKMMPQSAHLSCANGTKAQNVKYCTKEESRKEGPWIHGTCTCTAIGEQGKRTDLSVFGKAAIDAGGLTDEVIEQFTGHALQFGKHVQQLIHHKKVMQAEKDDMEYWVQAALAKDTGAEWEGQKIIKLIFMLGPTAVGKTTHVKLQTLGKRKRLYEKDGSHKWFDGYDGQVAIMVDEMTTKFVCDDIRNFNRITNVGTHKVEIKGGFTLLEAEEMWITSNKHPLDIFGENKNSGTYKAFCRRFTEVWWWNDKKELIVLDNPGNKEDYEDEALWKKACHRWLSFWDGKSCEGMTVVPGEPVKDYFSWGIHK